MNKKSSRNENHNLVEGVKFIGLEGGKARPELN
jgi:hypothetical protein